MSSTPNVARRRMLAGFATIPALAMPMPAFAQGAAPQPGGEAGSPAHQEYMAVAEKMHERIRSITDRDPTREFCLKMIAYYEGSIDLSRVVLKYSRNRKIRDYAHRTINGQQKEIRFMQAWLDKNRG